MSKVLLDVNSRPDAGFSEKNLLNVSEFFSHTIQGEGRFIGHPAAFLRLKGCTLSCNWCDTMSIWRQGARYTFSELFSLMDKHNVINFLRHGAHLVITGGSPLLQQEKLRLFILQFITTFGFKPFIEIENECIIEPKNELMELIDHWNCSPKLSNSLQKPEENRKPEAIKRISENGNCDFKFVISEEKDWEEIKKHFIDEGLITPKQIILMPEGKSQGELNRKREMVVDLAVKRGVRFSDRLHITIWDKKTGV